VDSVKQKLKRWLHGKENHKSMGVTNYMKTLFFLIFLFSMFSCNDRILDASLEYEVSAQEPIDADIYFINKTVDFKDTKELIVHFKSIKNPKYLTIAIPAKLIGLPENSNKMEIIDNKLHVPEESLIFTPISEGAFSNLDYSYVSDSVIYFSSFSELKQFGKKITIRKKKSM
jgi:hypothetical protein